MAKRAPKTGNVGTPAKGDKGRVVTFKQGWGAEAKEIAPEPTPPEPVVVPEGAEAVQALRELGELNDLAIVAKDRWADAAARAKDLKAKYDDAVEAVQKRLQKATHPPALPLFDAVQAEQDRQKMAAGPVVWGSGVAPVDPEPVPAESLPEAVTEPTESAQDESSAEGSTPTAGEASDVF